MSGVERFFEFFGIFTLIASGGWAISYLIYFFITVFPDLRENFYLFRQEVGADRHSIFNRFHEMEERIEALEKWKEKNSD